MKVNNVEIGILNLSKIQDIIEFIKIINQQAGDYILQHNTPDLYLKLLKRRN